ncbi:MAG: AraC family ligand binding domain-containing protein [Mucilaginibacter sp.]
MKNTFQSGKIPEFDLEQISGREGSPIKIVQVEQRTFRQKAVFLSPHRKNFYHFVYVKQGTGRHWVDMVPYNLKPDTFYITVPEQVHLKEEATLSGTLISFTKEYFAFNPKWALENLPVIKNSHRAHELILQHEEVNYIEDLLEKLLWHAKKSLSNKTK